MNVVGKTHRRCNGPSYPCAVIARTAYGHLRQRREFIVERETLDARRMGIRNTSFDICHRSIDGWEVRIDYVVGPGELPIRYHG